MASSSGRSSKSQRAYCSTCKEEFLIYQSTGKPQCPRCGRRSHTLVQRRLLRLIALALMAGLIVAALIAVYLSQ